MQAFMNEEKLPANMALAAYLMNTFVRVGANTDKVAISMPIVPKLANPHNAYVAITIERSFSLN